MTDDNAQTDPDLVDYAGMRVRRVAEEHDLVRDERELEVDDTLNARLMLVDRGAPGTVKTMAAIVDPSTETITYVSSRYPDVEAALEAFGFEETGSDRSRAAKAQ